MTLGEAIRALRAVESAKNDMTEVMSQANEQAFEQHDAVHVLFGCGTSLEDEIAAHVWMLLGTTAKIRDMHQAVAGQEHRNVLAGLGPRRVAGVWLRSGFRLLRIACNALRMKRRVAFHDLAQLKQQDVEEIRRAHGIRLVPGPGAASS